MKSVNTDVAYDYIRKKILSGDYPPGQALMTEILAGEIGVSRTPVRDALRKLETDGLVTIQAHIGAQVKKMDFKDFRESCEMRLALEAHAAGLAAKHRVDTDLHEIRFALEAMRGLTERLIASPEDEPVLSELVREDVRFHVAVISAAKNDLIKKEILRLHLINRVVMMPAIPGAAAFPRSESNQRRRVVMGMHEAVYTAISQSDAEAAKRQMELHLQEMIDHSLLLMSRTQTGLITRELTAEELAYSS